MIKDFYRLEDGHDHSNLKLDDILVYGDNSSLLKTINDDQLLRRVYIACAMMEGIDETVLSVELERLLNNDSADSLFVPLMLTEIETHIRHRLCMKPGEDIYAFWVIDDMDKSMQDQNKDARIGRVSGRIIRHTPDVDLVLYRHRDNGEALVVSKYPLSSHYSQSNTLEFMYTRKLDNTWEYIEKNKKGDIIRNDTASFV